MSWCHLFFRHFQLSKLIQSFAVLMCTVWCFCIAGWSDCSQLSQSIQFAIVGVNIVFVSFWLHFRPISSKLFSSHHFSELIWFFFKTCYPSTCIPSDMQLNGNTISWIMTLDSITEQLELFIPLHGLQNLLTLGKLILVCLPPCFARWLIYQGRLLLNVSFQVSWVLTTSWQISKSNWCLESLDVFGCFRFLQCKFWGFFWYENLYGLKLIEYVRD